MEQEEQQHPMDADDAEQRSGGEASTSGGAAAAAAGGGGGAAGQPKPIVVLVIGMAGSGKTTLVQRINAHMHAKRMAGYLINLDPAVTQLPYGANVDIRDTVDYKNVMKQYGLGPNGGILTACNLFATRFDQVVRLLERPRDPPLSHVFADTPGQIEIFTWSASGQLVTELLASSFPTVVLYVADAPRCAAPQTFMANMLQAVSILYKTRLPMLLAFNKVDVARHEFALRWMEDFQAFAGALEADASYAATLSRSLSLVLEEFYRGLRAVGVSALTGEGVDELFEALSSAAEEYQQYYVPELEAARAAKVRREAGRRERELSRLRADLEGKATIAEAAAAGAAGARGAAAAGPSAPPAAAAAGAEGGRQGQQRQERRGQQQQQQQRAEEEDAEGEGESADLELSDDSIEASVGARSEDGGDGGR